MSVVVLETYTSSLKTFKVRARTSHSTRVQSRTRVVGLRLSRHPVPRYSIHKGTEVLFPFETL
jgi:hypothetical protein